MAPSIDLPDRVWLDVPEVEYDLVEAVGAQRVEGSPPRWWVNPRAIPRAKVAQWLRPRLALGPTDNSSQMTVYAIPYRCWRTSCRTESLAVVAYRLFKDEQDTRGRGRVLAYWDAPLDFVDAALRYADVPDDLAVLRRRYSNTFGSVYMSNGCRACDALFGMFPLGEKYAASLELGRSALVAVARAEIPARLLVGPPKQRPPALEWADEDWSGAPPPRPEQARAKAGQRSEGAPHRSFGTSEPSSDDQRVLFRRLLGSGPVDPPAEQLTNGDFKMLASGRWGAAPSRQGTGHAFARVEGDFLRLRTRRPAFDVTLIPPVEVTELLLSLDDDEAYWEVCQAVLAATATAARCLEDSARVARVKPDVVGRQAPAPTVVDRGLRTQGGFTVRVPAKLAIGYKVELPAPPSAVATSPGELAGSEVHVHLVIPALCWVEDARDPGKHHAVTADGKELHASAPETDAVFRADLARRLDDLGYPVVYTIPLSGQGTWTLAGSRPECRSFLTMLTDPLRHLREEGRGASDGPLLKALRETRPARTAALQNLDRVSSRAECRALLAEEGAQPGSFTREPGVALRPTLEERRAELHERLRAELSLDAPPVPGPDAAVVRNAVATRSVDYGFTYDEYVAVVQEILTLTAARP